MKRRLLPALALFLLCTIAVYGGSRISISNMGDDIDVGDAPFGASLHSMGGNIRIGRAAGSVTAKTMGGNIAVEAMTGHRLDAGSMGGDIRVRVVGSGDGRDISLHTMGGTVELIVPHDFDATFLVEIKHSDDSSRSRIESNIPLSQSTSEHSVWFGRSHETITGRKTTSAQSNHVEISTYSNRVTIRRE